MRISNTIAPTSTATTHRRQQQHRNNLFIIFLICLVSVAVINIQIGGLGDTLCSSSSSALHQLPNTRLSVLIENNSNNSSSNNNNNSVAATVSQDGQQANVSKVEDDVSSLRKRQPNASHLSLSESTSQLLQSTHKRYAYVFYATGEQYACGALVNIQALRDLGTGVGLNSSRSSSSNNSTSTNTNDSIFNNGSGIRHHSNETTTSTTLDFIIVTYGFDTTALEQQAFKMNVIVKHVDHLNTFQGANYYYNDVMVKLRIFQLFEYHRIIFMDSDMLVKKNLDHLFLLPESSHIAAPRVYFEPEDTIPNPKFCSCLMVFTPTEHMWNRIMTYYGEDGYVNERELYDMDLLNREFGREATFLSGLYELLTAHLESAAEWDRSLSDCPNMDRKLGMPNKTYYEIYDAASIVHFTGLKPYLDRTMEEIRGKKSGADPRFFAIYERYFSLASEVCSFGYSYVASDMYSQYLRANSSLSVI